MRPSRRARRRRHGTAKTSSRRNEPRRDAAAGEYTLSRFFSPLDPQRLCLWALRVLLEEALSRLRRVLYIAESGVGLYQLTEGRGGVRCVRVLVDHVLEVKHRRV